MKTINFSEIPVGERFYFVLPDGVVKFTANPDASHYIKVEEIRRPYTPEAYSNASYDWRTKESSGTTFFYVAPTTKVILAKE